MEFKIENFGKIKEASLKLNGITVIAGANNSGKSTVGKILFSSFNSLNDIDKKIVRERDFAIVDLCSTILRENIKVPAVVSARQRNLLAIRQIVDKVVSFLKKNETFEEYELKNLIVNLLSNSTNYNNIMDNDTVDTIVSKISMEINQIHAISDNDLLKEIVTRYFSNTFLGQVNSLCLENDGPASVYLKIKGKEISFSFNENVCTNLSCEVELQKKALYIDNPFLLDKTYEGSSYMDRFISNFFMDNIIEYPENGLFDSIKTQTKLEYIYKVFDGIIDGEVVQDDSEILFKGKKIKKPLEIDNLSTGLKAFIIINLLLKKNILNSKDVLILDEPEIHLHPEWQLKYAELIVLLQKEFDLTILITTHSSHFLEAIDIYSKIHGVKDSCSYYFAKNDENNQSEFEDVTENLSVIYKSLVTPSLALDTLKFEHGISDD